MAPPANRQNLSLFKGWVQTTLRRGALLDLRTNPTHAINATAEYAAHNLAELRRQRLISDESPQALAR